MPKKILYTGFKKYILLNLAYAVKDTQFDVRLFVFSIYQDHPKSLDPPKKEEFGRVENFIKFIF